MSRDFISQNARVRGDWIYATPIIKGNKTSWIRSHTTSTYPSASHTFALYQDNHLVTTNNVEIDTYLSNESSLTWKYTASAAWGLARQSTLDARELLGGLNLSIKAEIHLTAAQGRAYGVSGSSIYGSTGIDEIDILAMIFIFYLAMILTRIQFRSLIRLRRGILPLF